MPRLFGSFSDGYTQLWKAIIRPPRDEYQPHELGRSSFQIGDIDVKRTDIDLINPRGHVLKCSHFEPVNRSAPELPCVIYLHGNCSSRLEALSCLPYLLPTNMTLFCLDFSGSGLSGGDYVSLGYHERDDLTVVIEYLRSLGTVSLIGLWGRSMGAATSLMYGSKDPSIACMVLDSPFSDLRTLADELVADFVSPHVPRFMVGFGMSFLRSSIKSRAEFDISDLSPISHAPQCYSPALFIAAESDTFVRPEHSQNIFNCYAGDKRLQIVPGCHNSPRPRIILDSISIFLFNCLQCAKLPPMESRGIFSFFGSVRGIRGMGVGGSQRITEEDDDQEIQRAIAASFLYSDDAKL